MSQNISELWKYDQAVIQKALAEDFANFKSNPANYKIALFDPHTNGFKYLRTLIYQLCRSLTAGQLEKLAKISHRELGNPISVTYAGQSVCLDYLQALYEIEFIEQHFGFQNSSILEIGAGYGRTCHAILSNYKIACYDIVDLDVCLNLSRRYLKAVLDPTSYQKIRFISHKDFLQRASIAYDLCLNIDSMSEMDVQTVRSYIDYIDRHGRYFFVKNPTGKYLLKDKADDTPDREAVQHALQTGLLTDVIDIWNQVQVVSAAEKFVQAYQPGTDWMLVSHTEAIPWSYHWQALYRHL